jgi:hypothetical protein
MGFFMNCLICSNNCVGQPEVLILKGQGPLHASCLRTLQFAERRFRGLNIPALAEHQLQDLLVLLNAEIESRNIGSQMRA